MAKPTRYTAELIAEYTERGFWTSETIADLWDRNARELPDKEALVDARKRLTWSEANTWIDRIALGLLDLGFKRNDMVVIQLPNCVELCLLRVACEKAGLLFMPVIRNLRHAEMEHILSYTEAKGVVIPWKFRGFDFWDMVQQIRPNLPELKHVFVTGEEVPEGAISIDQMVQRPIENEYPQDYLQQTKCPATEFSMVLHTTGTTGFPKFVEFPICGRICASKVRCDTVNLTSDDSVAVLAPAAAGPNVWAYLDAPRAGAKIVMLEHWDAEEALKLIQREKVTVVTVVPALLSMMVRHPDFDKYDLSSVRFINSTGAPLSYQLALEAEEKFGCPVMQDYGAVDVGGVSFHSPYAAQEARLLTVGFPYPGNEVKLVDDEGREVAQGEVGEIMARGPVLDLAYHRDPEATWRAYTKDGWFRMGDLGKFDEKGNLMVVGRKKEMIIRGGQNIYPVEIENLLRTHPKVADIAIVAMPDPVMGERACAYVVPKPGQEFAFDEMVSFLKEANIAPYKIPERLEILEALPLAGGQKVDKKQLAQDIIEKLKAEGAIR